MRLLSVVADLVGVRIFLFHARNDHGDGLVCLFRCCGIRRGVFPVCLLLGCFCALLTSMAGLVCAMVSRMAAVVLWI